MPEMPERDHPSIQWLVLHIRQAVQAIVPNQQEEARLETLLHQLGKHHARRRFRWHLGIGFMGGSSLGLAAATVFDTECAELIEALVEWFGRPLVLELSQTLHSLISKLV